MPRWRTMMWPAAAFAPPLTLMPSILGLESLPFCVLPPAFLDALQAEHVVVFQPRKLAWERHVHEGAPAWQCERQSYRSHHLCCLKDSAPARDGACAALVSSAWAASRMSEGGRHVQRGGLSGTAENWTVSRSTVTHAAAVDRQHIKSPLNAGGSPGSSWLHWLPTCHTDCRASAMGSLFTALLRMWPDSRSNIYMDNIR